MKKNTIYILILVLIANVTFAQDLAVVSKSKYINPKAVQKTVQINEWSTTTARTIRQGRVETGLFAPLRFGLKNKMELQIHPLWFFVMPNARIKKNWTSNGSNKFQIATEHGFTYPTILLSLLSKTGVGGILPPTKPVPPILTLKNKLIVSYFYDREHSVSVKGALEFNMLQTMNTGIPDIQLLFIYPRTAVYNNFYTGEIALNFQGVFAKKIGYDADLRLFLIPNDDLTWVFEWNPKVYYNASNKLRIMLGTVLTTGNIPHEKQNFRIMPVLDLQFKMGKKKKS